MEQEHKPVKQKIGRGARSFTLEYVPHATWQECADAIGVGSRERARQIFVASLEKLRRRYNMHDINEQTIKEVLAEEFGHDPNEVVTARGWY